MFAGPKWRGLCYGNGASRMVAYASKWQFTAHAQVFILLTQRSCTILSLWGYDDNATFEEWTKLPACLCLIGVALGKLHRLYYLLTFCMLELSSSWSNCKFLKWNGSNCHCQYHRSTLEMMSHPLRVALSKSKSRCARMFVVKKCIFTLKDEALISGNARTHCGM